MSLLSNFAKHRDNKETIEQAIAEVGREIKPLENWIQANVNGSDSVRVIVGKNLVGSDPLIFEKGLQLVIRLQDDLDVTWNDAAGKDLLTATSSFLVLKYVIAAAEGLQFNQANARSYPHTARLALLSLDDLNARLEDAFNSTQELHKKYFNA